MWNRDKTKWILCFGFSGPTPPLGFSGPSPPPPFGPQTGSRQSSKQKPSQVQYYTQVHIIRVLSSKFKYPGGFKHVPCGNDIQCSATKFNFWSPWGRSLSLYYSMKELQKGLP